MTAAIRQWINKSLLKRVNLQTTESKGIVTTTVIGPLGAKLVEVQTWRTADKKIACKVGGPLKMLFQDKVDAFMAVINRLNIIAEVDGRNVYNLYSPPLPSTAGMRPLERKLRTMAEGIVFPAAATLSITPSCHCRCVNCLAGRFISPDKNELTIEEMFSVIDQAADLGVCSMIFTGGEPLWRSKVFDMIAHVDKARAHVLICTNGLMLTEKNVAKLKEAGLGALNISIDSDDPNTHDRLRQVPGCFAKAMAGAKRAREAGILTGITTYASHDAIVSGGLQRILQMAQDEGFHEVTILECVPTGKFLASPEAILGRNDIKRIRDLADKYNAMDHPMGITAQGNVNAYDGGRCFGAFSQFYMTCYGDITPCDFNPITFGNVREEMLETIWHKMVTHPEFGPQGQSCRMQSAKYRKKYIECISDDEQLPVQIDRLPGDGRLLPREISSNS